MRLPDELEPYRDEISRTQREQITIETLPGPPPVLWTSKFGGIPYHPKGEEYPVRYDGRPLFLLAQVNFAETPRVEPWPSEGMLQFFVADDPLLGLNLDHPTRADGFRVRFLKEIQQEESNLKTDFGFLGQPQQFPVRGSYAIRFRRESRPITVEDFRSTELSLADEDELLEIYFDHFNSEGHRLGGYPSFSQTDPREMDRDFRRFELLFQMDTDDQADIMWGDAGVGNFFIEPERLQELDFSEVLYNWDCG